MDIDIRDVLEGVGCDKRIGSSYLNPGIGFGGPCLIKDIKALIKISEESGYSPNFLKAVFETNENQIKTIINKVKKLTGRLLLKKTITIFGLTFKAKTNDVRTSLSLKIIDILKKQGAIIKAYDPKGIKEAKKIRNDISYFSSPYKAVEDSFCLLILTDWQEFKELDYTKIKEKMFKANIIDGRNVLDNLKIKRLGFKYLGVGVK